MSANNKFSEWTNAGLISESQAQKIIEFEKSRTSSRLTRGLYGLGVFTIFLGVLYIIGANWETIPLSVQLIHLLINSVFAIGIYTFDRQNKELPRELSVLGLTGLTLTFIFLSRGVFKFDYSFVPALILWMTLSTPFVITYGKTKISLIPWLISFAFTIFISIGQYIISDPTYLFPMYEDNCATLCIKSLKTVLYVGQWFFLPIIFIQLAGGAQKLNRPVLQKLLFYAGITGAIIATNIFCQCWDSSPFFYFFYTPTDPLPRLYIIGIYVLASLSVFFITRSSIHNIAKTLDNTRLLLLGSMTISVLPFVFPYVNFHWMEAITFIAYWIFLGFIGQRTGNQSLVTASVSLAAIRIYLIYLEKFQPMLEMDFGLIFSGLLLIAMVAGARQICKWWHKKL